MIKAVEGMGDISKESKYWRRLIPQYNYKNGIWSNDRRKTAEAFYAECR